MISMSPRGKPLIYLWSYAYRCLWGNKRLSAYPCATILLFRVDWVAAPTWVQIALNPELFAPLTRTQRQSYIQSSDVAYQPYYNAGANLDLSWPTVSSFFLGFSYSNLRVSRFSVPSGVLLWRPWLTSMPKQPNMAPEALSVNDPRVEHHFIDVGDGIRYHYILAGPQGKPIATVLLLHGW